MTPHKSNTGAQAQSKHGPCRALAGPGRAFAAQDAPTPGQGTEAARRCLVAPAIGKSAKHRARALEMPKEIGGPESRAERLALAGAVAPTLRAAQERRIARVDADGNVVGYTTHKRLAESLLARQQIEIAVVEGVRPKTVMCEVCGLPAKVLKVGAVSKGHSRCMKREANRKRQAANPEKKRAADRKRYAANPEKARAAAARTNASTALRTGNPATAVTRAEGILRRAGWAEADIAAFLKARKP